MELTKAIELKELELTHWPAHIEPDLRAADQLSIEALKRELEEREAFAGDAEKLLPGETQPETLLHPTRNFIGNRP